VIYTFANCELDTEGFELRRDGVAESVEPQVFEVLAYLLAHRDRVVSREELLAQVWGHAYVSDTALTSRLRDARRAVGDSGSAQRLIRTIRGRGYRFVGDVAERDGAAGGTGASPVTGSPAAERARVTPWMAGREREAERLGGLFGDALDGTRQLVIVTGEPGIGKTTLIESFLAQAAAHPGVVVATGRCVDQRGAVEPYMPVLDALAGLAATEGVDIAERLERIAPSWIVQMPWLVDDAALTAARDRAQGIRPERMLREISTALEAICADNPLILALDDLHWADEPTIDLLIHLARGNAPARLLIVGATRPARDARVEALIRELEPRGRCVTLPLSPLADEEVARYVERRLPGLERDDVATALSARSDGNPLFMECLVGSWIEAGALESADGRWLLHGEPERIAAGVPRTLRGLIDQDIRRLAAADRELLEIASVAGRDFAASAVASAAGVDDETAERRCSELAGRGRVIERGDPVTWPNGSTSATFAFHHDLHRQVLYESLPVGRRARAHREIADALEAAYAHRAPEHAAELAAHYLAAGAADQAVGHLALAAEQANSRGAPREALTHLTAALELLRSDASSTDPERSEMRLLAGVAGLHLALEGYSSARAEQAYLRALELSRAIGDDGFTALLLYRMAGMSELRGEYATTEELLADALEVNDDPEPARLVETHELMACSLFHQGSFDEALEHAERGLAHYEPQERYPDPAFESEHPAVACNDWAGLVLWCLGRFGEARARIGTALELADRDGHRHGLASARIFAAHLHGLLREHDVAGEYAEAALALATERQIVYQMAVGRILLGSSLSQTGSSEQGIELMRQGLGEHEATGARVDRAYYLGLMAQALLTGGRDAETLATVDEALSLVGRDRPFYFEPELHRLRAATMRRANEAQDAETALRRGLEAAERHAALALELRLAADLVRLTRGRDPEYRARLERACRSFDATDDAADLREARDLLREYG
jgi:DNA-binding winged helix-turn-helix (wHTH) protein/tetratricopeptide (TPR) repeat protein